MSDGFENFKGFKGLKTKQYEPAQEESAWIRLRARNPMLILGLCVLTMSAMIPLSVQVSSFFGFAHAQKVLTILVFCASAFPICYFPGWPLCRLVQAAMRKWPSLKKRLMGS